MQVDEKKNCRVQAKKIWSEFLHDSSRTSRAISNLRPVLDGTGRILGTSPLEDEIDILELLVHTGREVYLPRVLSETEMNFFLYARDSRIVMPLERGPFGTMQPSSSAPQIQALTEEDKILIPSLGCNAEFFRLGRGGGYYDRWREHMIIAQKIAILPSETVSLSFQKESHDMRLDTVVTENDVQHAGR